MHSDLRELYEGLLANPAISEITVGAHWDQIQLSDLQESPARPLGDLDLCALLLDGTRVKGRQMML